MTTICFNHRRLCRRVTFRVQVPIYIAWTKACCIDPKIMLALTNSYALKPSLLIVNNYLLTEVPTTQNEIRGLNLLLGRVV